MARASDIRNFLKTLPREAINKIEFVVFKDIETSFRENIDKLNVADLDTDIDIGVDFSFDKKDEIYKRTMYYIFKYSGFYSKKIQDRGFTDTELNTDYKNKVALMTKSLKFDKVKITSDIKLNSSVKSIRIETDLTVNSKDPAITKLATAFLHGGEANLNDSTVFIEKMDSIDNELIEEDINIQLNKWIDNNYKDLYKEIGKKFGKEWPKKMELK